MKYTDQFTTWRPFNIDTDLLKEIIDYNHKGRLVSQSAVKRCAREAILKMMGKK